MFMTILTTNKKAQEHLQEIRNPRKDSIRYRKRIQEEKLADKTAKDELSRLGEEDATTISPDRVS
jgi:hypothetical protein